MRLTTPLRICITRAAVHNLKHDRRRVPWVSDCIIRAIGMGLDQLHTLATRQVIVKIASCGFKRWPELGEAMSLNLFPKFRGYIPEYNNLHLGQRSCLAGWCSWGLDTGSDTHYRKPCKYRPTKDPSSSLLRYPSCKGHTIQTHRHLHSLIQNALISKASYQCASPPGLIKSKTHTIMPILMRRY